MNSFILDFEKYNLIEDEINSFIDANNHYLQKHNLYALHEVYTAFYINILRRVEFFGISPVLEDINKNNLFDATCENILKRWEKFEQIDIIKSLRHLKIINNQTYSLFFSFYNSKLSITLDDEISEEYLFSFFNLLKVQLLEHEFIKYDKNKHKFDRRKNKKIEEKRRKEDIKEKEISNEKIDIGKINTDNSNLIHPVHLHIKEKLSAKDLYNIKDKKENEDDDEIEAIYI